MPRLPSLICFITFRYAAAIRYATIFHFLAAAIFLPRVTFTLADFLMLRYAATIDAAAMFIF